ncbi:hypothetical protein J4729_04910 [Leisingera sp. HS039]|uniref:hypothetical protein n=1 Tax=unclassified Leisingera TaxID=2614906 RepID=UPI001070D581|nr:MULTISPECIES: hypothetical protein [unclassified Leisingera]MBQ4823889.1 hypothetical protein [Leisingera sp. HS039]QBR35328.1 hypothetical protein ETW23_03380 [Leisingera sp. NJS201]
MSQPDQKDQIPQAAAGRKSGASELRQIARALQLFPPPQFSIFDLVTRWQCSRSSVERFRKKYQLKSSGPADEHPRFDLIDILRIEKIPDPEAAWALGSDDDRRIFSAPLLSIEDLQLLDPCLSDRSLETFRRRARAGKRAAFKLGNRWLFRPEISDLERLRLLTPGHPGGM